MHIRCLFQHLETVATARNWRRLAARQAPRIFQQLLLGSSTLSQSGWRTYHSRPSSRPVTRPTSVLRLHMPQVPGICAPRRNSGNLSDFFNEVRWRDLQEASGYKERISPASKAQDLAQEAVLSVLGWARQPVVRRRSRHIWVSLG